MKSATAEPRALRVRITRSGNVKLHFYHSVNAVPPFRVTMPREQWDQIAAAIQSLPPEASWEAYFGFTEQTLALHQIDAVPLNKGEAEEE